MAKQDLEKNAPPIPDEQLSDILLIMDKKELSVRAVSEIGKDGKAKTVPADKKHQDGFLKIDYSSNIVSNFLSNFWRQAKDPTRFKILKMAFDRFNENQELLKDLTLGKETPETKQFLEKHGIKPEGIINKQKLLDNMLKGYKTNELVPVSMNFGSAVLRTDARLSFQQSSAGPVVLAMHGIRKDPELDRPFFGHIFSDEDKKNLRETGNMGRVVEIKNRQGDYVPSFISIDRLTNEVVAMKADSVYIPDEIKGIKLNDYEKNELKDEASGRPAYTRYNPDSPEGAREIYVPKEMGSVRLTPEDREQLREGKPVFLENIVNRKGEEYSSFVKLDLETGRPQYAKTLVSEKDINWDELAAIGILREELSSSGNLEPLLKGEKTEVITLQLMLLGVDVDMDAGNGRTSLFCPDNRLW
jgi:hypothetical protein